MIQTHDDIDSAWYYSFCNLPPLIMQFNTKPTTNAKHNIKTNHSIYSSLVNCAEVAILAIKYHFKWKTWSHHFLGIFLHLIVFIFFIFFFSFIVSSLFCAHNETEEKMWNTMLYLQQPTWDTWQRRRTAPSSEPSTSSASSWQPPCPWWTALSPPCGGGTIIKMLTTSCQRRSNLVEKVLPELVDGDERAGASDSGTAVDQDCSGGIWWRD